MYFYITYRYILMRYLAYNRGKAVPEAKTVSNYVTVCFDGYTN